MIHIFCFSLIRFQNPLIKQISKVFYSAIDWGGTAFHFWKNMVQGLET